MSSKSQTMSSYPSESTGLSVSFSSGKDKNYGSTQNYKREPKQNTSSLNSSEIQKDLDKELVPKTNVTNRRGNNPTSEFETIVHMVKANVGTGLLALPLAVKNAGLAFGGVSLLLLGILATHCMILLVNVARELVKRYPEKYVTLNYAEVATAAVAERTNKKWILSIVTTVVNTFLIITQFGFCCVYFVFIAVNLNQTFCSTFGIILDSNKNNAIHAWIAIIIIPIAVFCWIRNLKSLSPFSVVANFCILFSLAVILYEEIHSFVTQDPEHQAAIIRPKNVTDSTGHGGGIHLLPTDVTLSALFFGNAIYSFEGIGMVLPLENKIRNPHRFKAVMWIGMAIVIFLYVFVGVLGYAVYGESIQASITLNLELSPNRIGETIFFLLAKLSYTYAVFASFMLQFYVPMDFLEPFLINWILDFLPVSSKNSVQFLSTLISTIFRTLVVLVIASFALALPDLGDLISLIGAVASSALALIFPALLHILVFTYQGNTVDNKPSDKTETHQVQCCEFVYCIAWVTKDALILLFGVVGLGFGTYAAINGLVGFLETTANENNTCVNFFPH